MKKYLFLLALIQTTYAKGPVIWGPSNKAQCLQDEICFPDGSCISGSSADAITELTGDVSANGPGSAPATVNSVGGATSGQISQSVADTEAATQFDAPDTIVKRDPSGFVYISGMNMSSAEDRSVLYSNSGDIVGIAANLSFSSGNLGIGTDTPQYLVEIHSTESGGNQPGGLGFVLSDESTPQRIGGMAFGGANSLVMGSFSDVAVNFVGDNGNSGGFLLTTATSSGSAGNSFITNGDIGFMPFEIHSVPTLAIRGKNNGGAVELYGYSDPDTLHTFGQGQLNLYEMPVDENTPGTNFIGLKAPSSVASDVTFILPGVDGVAGQHMQTNGSAALSFGSLAASNLTTQGAAITPTTIYAVPAAGAAVYRVSWVATVTRAATNSSILGGAAGFQLVYTDADDSVVKTSNPTTVTVSAGNTTATSISGSFIANCKASTNLQYSFGYTSVGVTTMQYNLHIRVEAL